MGCTRLLPSIVLTEEQMDKAAQVAARLHNKLRARGVKNAHGMPDREATASLEAGGAAAELAAALLLDVPWTAGETDDPYGADIGLRTQVRSSAKSRASHSLIVRPRDIEKYGNVPFVLMIQTGCVFRCHGWAMSEEVVRAGKKWDGGLDRPEAYFLHESKLHTIEMLKEV